MCIKETFNKYSYLSEPFYFDQSKLMTLYEGIIQRTTRLKASTKCVQALTMFPELHLDPSQRHNSCWTLVVVVVEVVSDRRVWLASL